MHTIAEIHQVTYLGTDSKRSGIELNARSRIHDAVHIIPAQTIHRAGEGAECCWTIIETEVHKTAFDRSECPDCLSARLELRTE